VALGIPPMLLVFKEPDFGTAIIYVAAIAAILFLACVPWTHLAALAAAAALVLTSLVWLLPAAGVEVLQPYQVDRLTGFLHPDVDPSGTTYNVNQSITAVGSGGLDGRGVVGATQTNMNYLPEHKTDFIFSALAEQRGFLGASVLLLLYALIAWRGIKVIAVARDLFSAAVAGAIVTAFLFQVFVNVGMTIGIAPITGIPLPFVSFGGSSLITMMFMVGLLEAIHVRGRLAGRS
jgi:rod shape determining protein RodA